MIKYAQENAPHFMPSKIAELERLGRHDEANSLRETYESRVDAEADGFFRATNRALATFALGMSLIVGGTLTTAWYSSGLVQENIQPAAEGNPAWDNQARYDADQAAAQNQMRDYNKMYGLNP
jgi:hypothetical protein